jgi:selenium metabolism protein YedF
MSEIKIVNATGLNCPQPVVLAKEAIEKNEKVMVIVDNETALENVTRMGTKLGCDVATEKKAGGIFEITMTRKAGAPVPSENVTVSCNDAPATAGPFVIVCAEDKMGRGSDELGSVLMRAFLHTICLEKKKPDVMIFYNTGVKLTLHGAETLEDLKELAAAGVELLVCGTCLNYFEVKDKLGVGVVSNMYDIAGTMSRAGRLLTP